MRTSFSNSRGRVSRARFFARALLAASLAVCAIVPRVSAAPDRPLPPRAQQLDQNRLDPNQISMFVTSWGPFAFDPAYALPGLEYPKGSGKTAVFSSALWLAGTVSGQLRVAVSDYQSEYQPGAVFGGVPEFPGNYEAKVYKLERVYEDTTSRDSALADYNAGAIPRGAPAVNLRPDGKLDLVADQMVWTVYNELDPNSHTHRAGHTPPLGIEIQQTAYAFDRPGPLGNTALLSFRVRSTGSLPIQDFYVGLWSDPDLGGAFDDLTGSDPGRSLGFCYNASDTDAVYGSTPPAVGYDLLRATQLSTGQSLPATSFIKYVNGQDPADVNQTYAYLRGLDVNGAPIVDPTNGQVTTFMHTGDPVTGTGWLDDGPSDRRFLLTTGPFDLAPGDGIQLDAAIVIGQGSDRLASITALLQADDEVQRLFDRGFSSCDPVAMGFEFTPNTLNLKSMGRWVNGYLEPPAPYETGDIDVASIRLNGVVAVDPAAPSSVGDHNGNGRADLMVKFDRGEVQATLPQGNSVPVQVTGAIADRCFEGGTLTRAIHAPVTSPPPGAVFTPGVITPIHWGTPAGVSPRWVAFLSSLDGGESWHLEAKYLPNYGTTNWTVPYASTDRARVAVVLVEEADETGDQVEGVVGVGPTFRISGTTGVGEDQPGLALLGTVPNPARRPFPIAFRLPDRGPASLSLYDLAGRRRWERQVGDLGPGSHVIAADECPELPAGVYVVRLRHGAESRTARVVLVE